MNLFFAFDEYSDISPPEVVRQYADIVMDTIINPSKPRPSDEVVLGVIAQEYNSFYLHVKLILTMEYRFGRLV